MGSGGDLGGIGAGLHEGSGEAGGEDGDLDHEKLVRGEAVGCEGGDEGRMLGDAAGGRARGVVGRGVGDGGSVEPMSPSLLESRMEEMAVAEAGSALASWARVEPVWRRRVTASMVRV